MSITLQFPPQLEPFLQSRMAQGFSDLQDYFLSLAEMDRSQQAAADQAVAALSSERKSRLDDTLRQRDAGPFETLDLSDDSYWNQLKQEGRQRAAALAHA